MSPSLPATRVRCVVVEDEPLALERLRGYIGQLPLLQLAAAFDNAGDALAHLISQPTDLLFLDINLGGISGIELLESHAVNSAVILTTAHAEHAVRAYDLKVADYLLKPFMFPRFVQAVDRATSTMEPSSGSSPHGYFFVRTELRLERVGFAELLYIEGAGDYRNIQTLTRRIRTLETFGDLEARLPASLVARVHKSYMVVLGVIESVERDRIVIRGKYIPVSGSYRDAFYARIGHGRGAR